MKTTMKKIVTRGAVAATLGAGVMAGVVNVPTAQAAALNYGAIAVSPSTGASAWAINFSTRAGAEVNARQECGYTDCQVLTSYANACGAVAYSASVGYWTGGADYTLGGAYNDARGRNYSDSYIVTWACTDNYGY